MNITPQTSALPLATVVNQPTDSLRRENVQRDVITQPTPTQQSSAEKGVASERERAKTPTQNNENIDFSAIQKKAQEETTTINDGRQRGGERENSQEQQDAQNSHSDSDHEHSANEEFQELKEIRGLQSRDREVRAHERAHASVGGAFTGSPSYTFETGPDGKKYAVAGEVSVDLSPISGNPRATIAKMQKVRAAALAPADPSIQDTKVAASAQVLIAEARSELLAQQTILPGRSDDEESSITSENGVEYTGARDTLRSSDDDVISSDSSSNDFDSLINQTLSAQEQIAPDRGEEINQRANRIENFYLNINQAYEKPPKFQFELTA